ncbi:hypothetical protein GCM10025864_37810 [Luteimicrobium album]|uniref:Uncharacterized protein n=1 Tax=Luteimicrobium album TaxID=1054550 RepID=A0ABQ6I5V2_9MICO|nr:hypothetical protein GCM10025864_37810 [Luteimicrobium album]
MRGDLLGRDGRGGRCRRVPGEREHVLVLGGRQAHGHGQRVEDLPGGVDLAALLEPRVPGDAHPGPGRDLLAAQPRRAPARDGRQVVLGPVELLAPRAEERAELLAPLGVAAHVACSLTPPDYERDASSPTTSTNAVFRFLGLP